MRGAPAASYLSGTEGQARGRILVYSGGGEKRSMRHLVYVPLDSVLLLNAQTTDDNRLPSECVSRGRAVLNLLAAGFALPRLGYFY